ncbi:MAG: PaaI family thioesterase [Betaproteobacteria bacterium]
MAEYRSSDDFQRMFQGTLSDRLGMRIVEVTPDRVVMIHPGVTTTADLHAVTAVLAESAGSAVAVLAAQPGDAVGIELSITHHPRPAAGEIIATATLLSAAAGLLTCAISITDSAGSALAEARLQCMARTVRRVNPA